MIDFSIYIAKQTIDETLAQDIEVGKRQLEPFKAFAQQNKLPITILEDTNVSNDVEVHRHEGDLWICLSGEVEFVVGGVLVEPWAKQLPDGGIDDRELKAKILTGGERYTLREGDILWIPAGQPHLHKTSGTARLYIIKVPTLTQVPLEQVSGWPTA